MIPSNHIDIVITKIQNEIKLKNWDSAKNICTNNTLAMPEKNNRLKRSVLRELSKVYTGLGNYKEARAKLFSIEQYKSEADYDFHEYAMDKFLLGLLEYESGDINSSLITLNECLASEQKNNKIIWSNICHLIRGYIFYENKKYAQALNECQQMTLGSVFFVKNKKLSARELVKKIKNQQNKC